MSNDDDRRRPLDRLARGLTRRTFVAAKLAGRVGLRYATRGSKNGEAVDTEAIVARAKATVQEIGALKGMTMKVGQMASYLPGLMPPEAQAVFEELQSQSTPMVFSEIERVLRAELGQPVSKLFDEFDETPIAAASIGQVHRARYQGVDVAVKIQYPDIEDLIRSDLKMMGMLTRMMSVGTPNDGGALAEELRARMIEECDYGLEARRQKLFKRLIEEFDGCHVPEVVEERSSRRVLTTHFVTGRDFSSFCADATQAEKNDAALAIFRACFFTLFRYAIYNGDPHPGNYLFGDDGSVTFLDFGCVREFSTEFIDNWKPVEIAMLDQDREALRRAFPATNMVGVPLDQFDWEHHWQTMQYVCRPYLADQPFTFTQDYVSESYEKILFNKKTMKMLNTPPEWLLLNRVHWGLNSILGRLEASGHWGDLWREAVSSPTTPAR